MDSVVSNPNFIEMIISLGATLLLILFVSKKLQGPYQEYMAKRKEYVNSAIDESRRNATESAAILEEVSALEADIKSQKSEIIDRAKDEAMAEKTEIIKNSKEEARRMIEKANEEIANDKERVQSEISGDMVELVNLVSAKFIAQNITEEEDMALINNAIGKVNEN